MDNKKIVFECRDISKYFGPTKAVDHVDLAFYPGEIRGLCGENGSGKSTLVSMIAAVLENETGEMYLEGKPYAPTNQLEANDAGIYMIKQEMGTIDGLTVAENIFFGHEKRFSKFGLRDLKRLNGEAKQVLNNVSLDYIEPGRAIDAYNFEQRKAIELAKAVGVPPKILIVDETTTALSHEMRDFLYNIIKDIREHEGTVIFISHDLPEVLDICDNVTVLKDGKIVNTFPCSDITENDLKTAMVGRELSGDYYRSDMEPDIFGEVVFETKNICIKNLVQNISIQLHKGEILGIGGLSEAGMHEFGKVLFGLNMDQTGEVVVTRNGARINCIADALTNGVGYVPKNRDQEGLFLEASIKNNIGIANLDKVGTNLFINPHKINRFAQKHAEDINVKMVTIDQFVNALSGGNKQKVSLAKWLARDAEILILDSPTRGIDVMVKALIYKKMIELKKQGISIIMLSEELMELIGMCDRILVFANGKVNGEFLRSPDLSEEAIIQKMI